MRSYLVGPFPQSTGSGAFSLWELIDSLVQPFRIVEDSELSDKELLLLKKMRPLPPEERIEEEVIVDMKIDKERKRANAGKGE